MNESIHFIENSFGEDLIGGVNLTGSNLRFIIVEYLKLPGRVFNTSKRQVDLGPRRGHSRSRFWFITDVSRGSTSSSFPNIILVVWYAIV